MRSRLAVLAPLVLLLVGLLLAPPPSYAATWRHTDATGDVVVQDSPPPGSDTYSDPAVVPGVKYSDIRSISVSHAADVLRVTTSLRASDTCDGSWVVTVVTSRGDRFTLGRGRNESDGCVPGAFFNPGGKEQACPGLRATRTSAGYVATVPTSCLGDPYRVRVGVQSFAIYRPAQYPLVDNRERIAWDDGLRTGRYTQGEAKLGPWVARG